MFMCVYVYLCVTFTCRYSWNPEEGDRAIRTGVIGCCLKKPDQ